MAESPTLEIREPTGLSLGTFDLFQIRQRIYVGEFHNRCEFRRGDGPWRPLPEHAAFGDVFWIIGVEGEQRPDEAKRVSRFAGWQQGKGENRPILDAPPPAPVAQGGFLGRLFGRKG